MKLSRYKFEFKPEMMAKYPAENRDESRLMVIDRESGKIEHKVFKDMIDYFDEEDVLVFNDSKVFPARLYGYKEKTNADIQIFLLRELDPEQRLWDVMVEPARKIRIGNKLFFGEEDLLVAEVIDNTTSRGRTVRFLCDCDYDDYKKLIYSLGETPLPDWVRKKVEPMDEERYQTIFAKNEGSVAAPSAGLHFGRHLMKRLEIKGVKKAFITLHIGLGNFRDVEVEDLTKHKMDSEEIFITEETAKIVNKAKVENRRICAVGTTAMRTLESSVTTESLLQPFHGWTNEFIFIPYEFHVPNCMITNFHLPYSTQLMMVAAFGGYETIMEAYEIAKKEGYKFGPYGDAMLII